MFIAVDLDISALCFFAKIFINSFTPLFLASLA